MKKAARRRVRTERVDPRLRGRRDRVLRLHAPGPVLPKDRAHSAAAFVLATAAAVLVQAALGRQVASRAVVGA